MPDDTRLLALEFDSQRRLCDDLALALHAMAQPLTVLRGALGALALRGTSAPGADRYVALSHTQVEHLCSLLSSTRILLDSFQSEAVCAPTNLGELLASIVENEASGLHQSGLRISIREVDPDLRVLADPARMEQAMHAVFAAVSTASSQDSELCLAADRRDGFANTMVQAANPRAIKLTSVGRLHLFVAEASIRSQNGLFEFLADPFRISLKLPLLDRQEPCFALADLSSLAEKGRSATSFDSQNLELISQRQDW